jgi:hypothetical protein
MKMIYMKRYLLLLLTGLFTFTINAQIPKLRLSDSSFISLLTCEPIDEMAYTVYGHTAIRVYDPMATMDFVFNYGLFDFSAPNFLYRFTKGELNYRLGISSFSDFFDEYSQRRSGITEQMLNLTRDEKQRIFDALRINYFPENRVYRYNFLFDNCSTRPRILIEKNIVGTIEYPEILSPSTFRTIVHRCNRNHRWLTFGIDLALGAPLDNRIEQYPQMFLPENLMAVFDRTRIIQPDGVTRPLVSETRRLAPSYPIGDRPIDSNPVVITWLFFLFVVAISVWEMWIEKRFRIFDILLFAVYGIVGCVVFFLSFISIHPAVFPNYSIIWTNPLLLAVAVAMLIKPLRRFADRCVIVNGLIMALFIVGWNVFPQEFHPAFFPLVLILFIRSLSVFVVNRTDALTHGFKCYYSGRYRDI